MTATIRDAVSPDLRATLRALKLGQMLDTLPERLTLARQQKMAHADFLELILADEVTRREAKSAGLRARAAGLDPGCGWTPGTSPPRSATTTSCGTSSPRCGSSTARTAPSSSARSGSARPTWPARSATSRSGGAAPCTWPRAAKLFKRLKAARLDNTLEAEMRRLAGVELLILDDFALQPLDATETTDFYQLCVERHQRTSTVVTSNRTAEEWLAMMADPLLAQSAVDRLISTAHELVIEGESYRRRQKPSIHHSPHQRVR